MDDSIRNRQVKDYHIIDQLGKGSYGVVYRAKKQDEDLIYVLKQINLIGLDKEQQEEVNREATIMASLDVPYLVKYLESFIENNALNIVMEYCDGGDLATYLKTQKTTGKLLKEDKVWMFFIQICIGISHIHKKHILHRDLKTLNIFLTKDEKVRIGDLGVAKKMNSENSYATTFVGTPYYLSPEMCEEKPYNEKSDIWSLGCILYEMLTYNHPFNAKNPAALCLKILTSKYEPIPKEYSSEMKKIVELLLEKDYLKRPRVFEIMKNQIIINKARKLNIDIYDFNSTPLKTLDSSENISEIKKISTNLLCEYKNSKPLEVKVQLSRHNKRKSTDDPSFITVDLNGDEKNKRGLNNSKIELQLKGMISQGGGSGSNYNSNGNGNSSNNFITNSSRASNMLNLGADKKKLKYNKIQMNGVLNKHLNINTRSPNNNNNLEKILKMLGDNQKKTPIKIKNDSKQAFAKEIFTKKIKNAELELKLNLKPNTPIKSSSSNFIETKQRMNTPSLQSNREMKIRSKKIEFGACAKQINVNLSKKESPRVIVKTSSHNSSKDDLKMSSSRNVLENDLLFLKKLLPKNDYEKLLIANHSHNGMITSMIMDKYMETINKNNIPLHSYDMEMIDIEGYKEFYGNVSQILKSCDGMHYKNSSQIDLSSQINPIDISKSVSIENLSKIDVSKSISTENISNRIIADVTNSISPEHKLIMKEHRNEEPEMVIPLCLNKKAHDDFNDFSNEVCYIHHDSTEDKYPKYDSSNEISDGKEDEIVNVFHNDKEICYSPKNPVKRSNSFEEENNNEDCVVVVKQRKNEDQGMIKIKENFIKKIDKLKEICIKIISEEKFKNIYKPFANNSNKNQALNDEDLANLETLISNELSEPLKSKFFKSFSQLLLYELQLNNIVDELIKKKDLS